MAHVDLEYSDREYREIKEAEDDAAEDVALWQFCDDKQYHEARAFSHPQDATAKFSQWWLMRYAR